jgi:SOS-response transcriptional repressor LexA
VTVKARRADLVRLIEEHRAIHGFSPSVRELQLATGVASMSTTHRDLVALRDEGLIQWDPQRYRTIRAVAGS